MNEDSALARGRPGRPSVVLVDDDDPPGRAPNLLEEEGFDVVAGR
jgi:hypothetical protein